MIFKNGYKITQNFGERPQYYGQFGLQGHEGLDLIPTDSQWDIYAPEDGVIVRDIDDPRYGGAYGNVIVLLNKQNKRAWWFAHNTENYVKVGQEVKRGDKISKMGATGNVSGAHLHLGLRRADDNGNAINMNNGYQGFINPLPVLLELENINPPSPSNTNEDTKLAQEFRKLQQYPDAKGVWYESKDIIRYIDERREEIRTIQKELGKKDEAISQRDTLVAQLNTKVIALEEDLQRNKMLIDNLNHQINDRNNDIAKLQSTISTIDHQLIEATSQRDMYFEQAKQLPSLKEQIEHLEQSRSEWYEKEDLYIAKIKELGRSIPNNPKLKWVYNILMSLEKII